MIVMSRSPPHDKKQLLTRDVIVEGIMRWCNWLHDVKHSWPICLIDEGIVMSVNKEQWEKHSDGSEVIERGISITESVEQ